MGLRVPRICSCQHSRAQCLHPDCPSGSVCATCRMVCYQYARHADRRKHHTAILFRLWHKSCRLRYDIHHPPSSSRAVIQHCSCCSIPVLQQPCILDLLPRHCRSARISATACDHPQPLLFLQRQTSKSVMIVSSYNLRIFCKDTKKYQFSMVNYQLFSIFAQNNEIKDTK